MKKKSASQSAFFKFRIVLGVLLCFGAITLVLVALGKVSAQPQTSLGQSGNSQQPIYTAPQVQRQNPYSDAWLAVNHGSTTTSGPPSMRPVCSRPPRRATFERLLTPNYGRTCA